jgi:hypothetical protein
MTTMDLEHLTRLTKGQCIEKVATRISRIENDMQLATLLVELMPKLAEKGGDIPAELTKRLETHGQDMERSRDMLTEMRSILHYLTL